MQSSNPKSFSNNLIIRDDLQELYAEVYTPEVTEALNTMAVFNIDGSRITDNLDFEILNLKKSKDRQR